MVSKKNNNKQVTIQNQILGVFKNFPHKNFNYKQLARHMRMKRDAEKKHLIDILEEMEDAGLLVQTGRGKYKLKITKHYVEGVVDLNSSGNAYIRIPNIDEDVFIARSNTLEALPEDKVKVYLYPKRRNRKPEGEIVEILERHKTRYVGTIELLKDFGFLLPRDKRMPYDIFIPLSQLNGAKDRELAIVEITDFPKKAKNPMGKVVRVLGKQGENSSEMHAILASYGLPEKFPRKIEHVASTIPEDIPKDEIKKRKDYRTVPTITIDPADAKDFDDALSLQKLSNGNWEIGIHIADVSYYVQPNSVLDKEAYKRATSVYLVDRVVPMLPERLSNGLCSLRPNEEKLTYSVIFEMNENAQIKKYWIGRTIIKSDKRFSYEEAQEIIEKGQGEYSELILPLDKLAKITRKNRFSKGSIDFHRSEVRFELDSNGTPLSVYFKESKDANKLVEEFMLLANKYVAMHIGNTDSPKTFLYRAHDKPDSDKIQKFTTFIQKFGYNLPDSKKQNITKSLNEILQKVIGKKEQNMIETLAIRSMAKAIYTTKNIGHYGLNFDFYTHFTSPIRRYPDIMVHRLLEDYLHGKTSVNIDILEEKCEHSSEMERMAANAERDSIKYKQVEFMSDKVGEEFDGTISGVTKWGIYVEINDNKCEGMVAINSIDGDYYIFDEDNYCIVGKYSRKKFLLGDSVRIKVAKANLLAKQLDFELL